jgi:2-enoate reductase
MGNTDDVVPAETRRKVLVIGGGVAGMEAARISALRGHTVTLLEKEAKLGGTVEALSRNPLNSEFGNLVEYLTGQMARLEIDVRVCKRAQSDEVKAMGPDVVIIATGATMSLHEEAKGKFGVMTHTEALAQPDRVGKKVVIQGLGYGCELAIALAEEGKDVTLFGKGTEIASNVSVLRRFFILKRLTDLNVCRGDGDIPMTSPENPRVMTGKKLKEITPSEVVVEDDQGAAEALPYDTFIVSLGRRSNDGLYKELKETEKEVYAIGDAGRIGEILDAMVAANEVARKI